ncbi:palmitoyltransferase ZDHHC23 [Crotalus adamanteus]|uniref:Palmitoyltransferase n=1 Tax=Crotalus adamanteus TaxID=8729 RepID=A0AAW1BK61_CROAD
MVKRAGKRARAAELEDTLCCCEYLDRKGQRSHLAACLCECEDLDECCERWMTCKSLPPGILERITETFKDRYMYYVFLLEVVPRGHVEYSQVALLTCGLILMLAALHQAKEDPGYLFSQMSSDKTLCQDSCSNNMFNKNGLGNFSGLCRVPASGVAIHNNTESNSTTLEAGTGQGAKDWCTKCQLVRPARAGHCRICGRCVKRLDHHCVWINNCVGEQNHRAFVLALFLFLLTSVYGISLTLDTICTGKNTLSALFYCPGVYGEYSSALTFTCVWYCAIITSGMSYIFLLQLLNISYNMTEREARIALRENTGQKLLWGMVVDTDQYNRGFLYNWIQFFTLRSSDLQQTAENVV